MTSEPKWLTSTEVRQLLKISGCELMHRREHGEFIFKKVGNAYLYQVPAQLLSGKDEAITTSSPR